MAPEKMADGRAERHHVSLSNLCGHHKWRQISVHLKVTWDSPSN